MSVKYNALARLQVVAELRVTERNLEQDRGNKGIGYVIMPCIDFLKLTTTPAFYSDLMGDTIEPFSQREANKDRLLMPWLDIREDGKVIGHEGRHRAASLLKDGIKTLPVAIHLKDEYGHGNYYYEWKTDDGERHKRYLNADDVPPYWDNQFNTGFAFPFDRVKKTFKWHYEGWNA